MIRKRKQGRNFWHHFVAKSLFPKNILGQKGNSIRSTSTKINIGEELRTDLSANSGLIGETRIGVTSDKLIP